MSEIMEQSNVEQSTEKAEVMTFDEILSDKTYQSEFDKRVTKALDTAKTKWDTEKDSKFMKQFGIQDEKDLPATAKEFKAFLDARAKAEADKPEIERLKGEVESFKTISEENKSLRAENEAFKLDEIIRGKGLTDAKEIKLAKYEIRELIAGGKEMSEAAEEYFKANPVTDAPPKPQIQPKTPNAKVTAKEIDANIAAAAKGAGIDLNKLNL